MNDKEYFTNNKIQRSLPKGVSLIEILCFITLLGIIVSLTCSAFQTVYNSSENILLAISFTGFVFLSVIGIIFLILRMCVLFINIFFPSSPEYCESGKCDLSNCYHVRLGLLDRVYSIMYYQCQCGNEYVSYGCRFFAKVNKDGSLKPYVYNWFCLGWYQDNRINSEACSFKIPLEILKLLREKNETASFVHRDKNSNTLVLNTLTDLINNKK